MCQTVKLWGKKRGGISLMGDKRIDRGKTESEKGVRLATYLLCTRCDASRLIAQRPTWGSVMGSVSSSDRLLEVLVIYCVCVCVCVCVEWRGGCTQPTGMRELIWWQAAIICMKRDCDPLYWQNLHYNNVKFHCKSRVWNLNEAKQQN